MIHKIQNINILFQRNGVEACETEVINVIFIIVAANSLFAACVRECFFSTYYSQCLPATHPTEDYTHIHKYIKLSSKYVDNQIRLHFIDAAMRSCDKSDLTHHMVRDSAIYNIPTLRT